MDTVDNVKSVDSVDNVNSVDSVNSVHSVYSVNNVHNAEAAGPLGGVAVNAESTLIQDNATSPATW